MIASDQTGWLWENEKWIPVAGVPLTDRSFRHGISVFETIGIANGRLVFLDQHLAKLRQACAQTGLRDLPDSAFFSFQLSAFSFPPHGVARIYVTAGDGSLSSSFKNGRLFLFIEAREPVPAKKLRLRLHPEPVVLPFPSLKTGNYWLQIQAHQDAIAAGFDEAVLLNASDHVISAATGNLFAVIDGLLMTPRTSTGARPGVIRDWVLENAEVIVCDFHSAQLMEATEIFLTNSGSGIVSVDLLQNRAVLSQIIGDDLRTATLKRSPLGLSDSALTSLARVEDSEPHDWR